MVSVFRPFLRYAALNAALRTNGKRAGMAKFRGTAKCIEPYFGLNQRFPNPVIATLQFNRFRKLLGRHEKLGCGFIALNHLAAAITALRKVPLKANIIYR